MSLHEFQKERTPSIIQSLFRREVGLVGLYGNHAKETTNSIDVIIHRQLLQSRVPRSPPDVTVSRLNKSKRSDSVFNEMTGANTRSFGSALLLLEWADKCKCHVLILHDKVFIQREQDKIYIAFEIEIGHGLGQSPNLRTVYEIPSVKSWSGWDVWWPSLGSQTHILRQHGILFIVEQPGHVLQSFHFDSGMKYKMIILDPEVQFKSLEIAEMNLIINSVKASVGATWDDAVIDFIILNCPDLQLVTRCRITRAAVGNSTVEIHGDFIFLMSGHRIEVFDLKKTIELSFHLEPAGFVPAEGVSEGIPVTHLILEKPVCLFAVGNTSHSHLELGYDLWPPFYIKKNQLQKFEVLPMSEYDVLSSIMHGFDILNSDEEFVSHDEDNLCFHPDQSGRLIMSAINEIRIILLNDRGHGRNEFTVQFSKRLTTTAARFPEPSRRSGLRAIAPKNFNVYISDEDRGIIRWEYCWELDLFAFLEFSTSVFQIHLHDNQSWTPIVLINFSDLFPPWNNLNCDMDFIPSLSLMDVTDGFITVRQCSKTVKHVKKLYIVNLLSENEV